MALDICEDLGSGQNKKHLLKTVSGLSQTQQFVICHDVIDRFSCKLLSSDVFEHTALVAVKSVLMNLYLFTDIALYSVK